MDPLEIPLILERILSFVPHPIDLRNCRLVNQLWNSKATSALNDQGVTVVVSDENYVEYFRNRAKNTAGLNLTLTLRGQMHIRSHALLTMIQELLRQDDEDNSKTGTGSYCVKAINYQACQTNIQHGTTEYLEETLFWELLDVVAPTLEHLLVAGALDPPPAQSDKFEDIPSPPEPAIKFPALKSVIFDVRCHNRQKFIPRKLAQVLNNAPKLEEYKLISDQVDVEGDWNENNKKLIMFIPNEANSANIGSIASQLKTFGFFNIGFPMSAELLNTVVETQFAKLQNLSVLQVNCAISRPEFAQFLATNVNTLTSLEYTFVYGLVAPFTGVTRPPVLPNVTRFGVYYRRLFTPADWQDSESGSPRAGPRIESGMIGYYAEMLLQLRMTCLICPNLETLSTDMNICQALALFDTDRYGRPYRLFGTGHLGENGLEMIGFGSAIAESDNVRKEENTRLTTLKVTIPNELFLCAFRQPPNGFGDIMARYWSDKFPALHKLVVTMTNTTWWPGRPGYQQVEHLCAGIVNIPGITDLEIVDYSHDWIGQELQRGSGSLTNLQQGLRRLRLSVTNPTKTMNRFGTGTPFLYATYYHSMDPYFMFPFKLKVLQDVVDLCDSFQVLEEVMIDRRVFYSTNSTTRRCQPGVITTDKGVKITVL